MKAATALQLYHKKVSSGAEARKIDGIGVKIEKKIDEIIRTGTLVKLEKLRKDTRLQAIHQLSKVTGIG
jgi:DNA polymerase beta